MSPASDPHSACVSIVAEWFRGRIDETALVREEKAVALPSTQSAPEPDVAICDWRVDRYAGGKPEPPGINLVVEVAVSSLTYDRDVKAPLYAAAGIREYWIVNLVNRQLERYVHLGEHESYGGPHIYEEGATFEHQQWGRVVIADLLPMKVNGAS